MKTETKLAAAISAALLPAIGAAFEGGFYGGQIRSGDKIFAVVWSPKAQGEIEGRWMKGYSDIEGARSIFHSMDNTQAMAAAGSELAQRVLALDIGGHRDWCIPARDVLELGYRLLKPTTEKNWASFRDGENLSSIPLGYAYTAAAPEQTTVEAFREGGAEAFTAAWHWSSTQCSSTSAWYQYFAYGDQHGNDKKFEARARAVRLIQLTP